MFDRPFTLDKRNAKFMGVCAGIANYTGVDVTWVRIAWAAAIILGVGSPLIIYFIIAFVAPASTDVL